MAQFCGLTTSVPFPSLWTMAYQIAIFFVMEDTWHYFSHRALHWGPLYKAIHKIHHQYSAPFGLAAEYASPIEVMILGFGTVGCPILWCAVSGDLHILTMYIWIVLRLFQAIDAHSGYEFPWSLHHFLPFWAGADHHDLHHEKFIGNFSSSFRWWDYLLDTEYTPDALKRRRETKAKSSPKAQWSSFALHMLVSLPPLVEVRFPVSRCALWSGLGFSFSRRVLMPPWWWLFDVLVYLFPLILLLNVMNSRQLGSLPRG